MLSRPLGQGGAGDLSRRCEKVAEITDVRRNDSRLHEVGPADDQGDADAPFVEVALRTAQGTAVVKEISVMAPLVMRPVVRGEENNRPLEEPFGAKLRQEASHVRVETADHRRLPLLRRRPILIAVRAVIGDLHPVWFRLVIGMRQGGGEIEEKGTRFIPVDESQRVFEDQVVTVLPLRRRDPGTERALSRHDIF